MSFDIYILIKIILAGSFLTNIILTKIRMIRVKKNTGFDPITYKQFRPPCHTFIAALFIFYLFFIILNIGAYIFNIDTITKFICIRELDHLGVKLSGLIVIVFSLIGIQLGQHTLGNSFRVGLPTQKDHLELKQTGIYSLIRNPILGFWFLLLVGVFCIIPNIISVVMLLTNHIFINIEVRLEEEFLVQRYKEKYLRYYCRVGRFIPLFKPLDPFKRNVADLYRLVELEQNKS